MILPILCLASVWSRPQMSVDQASAKAAALLAKLTLDEKISMLGGVDGFFTHPIKRLNIPRFRMSDGPLGLRNQGPSTAYPAGVTLAASWDPALAHSFGTAIGIDARARGVHYWLGPGVDLDRIPENGRNFEYFGEDPILTADMAVQVIKGVQAEGVAATVKHYACNDNEDDRQSDDSIVDERTLHELQLVPFEAAVKQGHVWALMDGYNLVNGEHDSQNKILLTDILKDQWGFQGVVMSDWGATHSGADAFNAGQDLEMPGPDFMNSANLKPGLLSGSLSMSLLNDKILRQLRTAYALGWMDRDQTSGEPWVQPKNDDVALKIAEEGTALLKNQDNFLPLPKQGKTIVVIGPNAQPAVTNGGGSSYVSAHYTVGLLDAIKKTAPDAKVIQIPYTSDQNFTIDGKVTADGTAGWRLDYFKGKDLAGSPVATVHTAQINADWSGKSPAVGLGKYNWSARWTGDFTPSHSGEFLVRGKSDDGMRILVNGKPVISMWRDQGATEESAHVRFSGGTTYKIQVEYYQAEGDAIAAFGISDPAANLFTPAQSNELKNADAVIAAVGFNPSLEAEGRDRTWQLPIRQQELLDQASKLSHHLVILLNAGGAVDIARYSDTASAVIDSFYPGENGNLAIAKILFGDLSPSGHLPFVFPRKESDLTTFGTYPSVNSKIIYKEGVFIGERGLDEKGIRPLFPFGFGLTYAKFGDWKFKDSVHGLGTAEAYVEISGSVRNTSKIAGAQVVQVYAQFPSGSVKRPMHQLVGFQRVEADAGATAHFSIRVPIAKLGYWNTTVHNWRVDSGSYRFLVGVRAPTVQNISLHQYSLSLGGDDVRVTNASEKP